MLAKQHTVVLLITILTVFSDNVLSQNLCRTPDNAPGKCIPVENCNFIMNIIKQKPFTEELKEKARNYGCGFENNTPRVCCPVDTLPNLDFDFSNHSNINLINQNCGYFAEDRLIGGFIANLNYYPWMVLLNYKTNNKHQLQCDGTIINNNYVLTSAQCLINLTPQRTLESVRIGEHDITKDMDCEEILQDELYCVPPAEDVQISEIIIHPNFNQITLDNNVGLIRLNTSLNFSESVLPICLPTGSSNIDTKSNKRGVITGWGANDYVKQNNKLVHYSTNLISNEECQRNYSQIAPNSGIKIGENQTCTAEEPRYCVGDLGDPLSVRALFGKQLLYAQYGIFSTSSKQCSNPNQPKIFTKVLPYMEWILDNLKP